jgi:cyclic pyranopterin phosphate synthase
VRLPLLHPAQTPPVAPTRGDTLVDSHGRVIRDLRLSITDRCNFRCLYCMEPEVRFLPREQLLSVTELARLAGLCRSLGVRRVRLTGGEPTVRSDLIEIIEAVAATNPDDLAMTTNGSLVTPAAARRWKQAGLTRLTFSLDSLDDATFAAMTRSSCTSTSVVEAIRVAVAEGLGPVKVNAVVMRGRNEHQVVPLARLARDLAIEMRFIEYMPLDSGRAWDPAKLVPAAEIVDAIAREFPLVPQGKDHEHSTALEYAFADGTPGRIGLIAPVTRPFCGACSRLRITAEGKVRPCLFSLEEWDIGSLMRAGASDGALRDFLLDSAWSKQQGHGIDAPDFRQPDRPMSAIGG